MNYSEKILREQLSRLNNLYNKHVNLGSVKSDSKVALDNRKQAKDIETSLLILSGVVGQSEQYFCCNNQINQRCSKQCLGCFHFENKD